MLCPGTRISCNCCFTFNISCPASVTAATSPLLRPAPLPFHLGLQGTQDPEFLASAVLASVPGHPFWMHTVDVLKQRFEQFRAELGHILDLTGPFMLRSALKVRCASQQRGGSRPGWAAAGGWAAQRLAGVEGLGANRSRPQLGWSEIVETHFGPFPNCCRAGVFVWERWR